MSTVLTKMRRARICVLFISLLLVFGVVSYPRSADTKLKQLYSIGLGGVTGTANNTVLVFGRYVLVAPFAPTKGITETGDVNLSELDNSALYLIDVKKPTDPPITKNLTGWDASDTSRTVFFPSRVAYDANSKNVYVRGVRFEQKGDEITPIDVIAYVNLHQDADGKPVFDSNVVSIDIPLAGAKGHRMSPLYFAVSGDGDLLVFTNGASVFSYNLAEGYVQELGIVDSSEYGDNDGISYLDVDSATNIVSICRNRTAEVEGGGSITTSELSFYRLGRYGAFQFLTRVESDGFPNGSALSAGSNVAILSDAARQDWEFASFVTTDGSLCLVDLHEGDSTTARQLNNFPELAQSGASSSSPVLVSYDSTNRAIGIVKPGYTVQISRPSNGRGRISRPSNIHIMTGEPVLAMAKLNKKNKVASVKSFVDAFKDEGGLSNFVNGDASQWLVATYSGKLYSVNLGDDLSNSTLGFVGLIGSNVDRIDYYADRSSLVGISSFTMDPDGFQMESQGSLVVVKIAQSSDAFVQSFLPTAYTLVKQAPSIRRPSNIRR
jgi:hypothetical protein